MDMALPKHQICGTRQSILSGELYFREMWGVLMEKVAAEQINKHELSRRKTSLELGNGVLSEKTVQMMLEEGATQRTQDSPAVGTAMEDKC